MSQSQDNKDNDNFQLSREELKLVCMVMFELRNKLPQSISRASPEIQNQYWQLYYKLNDEFGSMLNPK